MPARRLGRTLGRAAAPLGTALALLLGAEVAARLEVLPPFVPPPSALVRAAVENPALVTGNLGPTALTALGGYAAAAAVTFAAAGAASLARVLHGPIANAGVVLSAVPVIATAPLLALWLGTGPRLHVVIAALACQFPLLVGAMQGLKAADARQRELLHVLSASRLQTLRLLLVPAALPYLFAGLKIAAPSAVLGAVTAEWAGADRGVGAMMLYALFSYDVVKVWLSVALACALAAGSYGAWALLERLALPWDRGQDFDQDASSRIGD